MLDRAIDEEDANYISCALESNTTLKTLQMKGMNSPISIIF
jgi:hypothetical protein